MKMNFNKRIFDNVDILLTKSINFYLNHKWNVNLALLNAIITISYILSKKPEHIFLFNGCLQIC